MFEKLSPSSAKPGYLTPAWYIRLALALCGVAVVLFGGWDMYTKMQAQTHVSVPVSRASVVQTPFRLTAPPLQPVRLSIPTLGVHADVEPVGNNAHGAMATPKKITNVAWYKLGAMPGNPGNAVFAGHVNNALTTAGVFAHLDQLSVGDVVVVSDTEGRSLFFSVTQIADYAEDDAPLAAIFAADGPSGLVLITCAGDWNPRARSYEKRLVVYTRLLDRSE